MKTAVWLPIALAYLAVFLAFDCLRFPVRKDETRMWPAALHFSRDWVPSPSRLRDYPEVQTPFSYVAFGELEHLFHGGIFAGRLVNFALSLVIVLIIASRSARAAWGLLLFPYYWFVSVHLYTDIIAAAWVLAGVAAYRRGRHVSSGLSFTLAVATRQYALVFPAAVLAYEILGMARDRDAKSTRWIPPLLACLSMAAWYLFFGGLGPRAAVVVERGGQPYPSNMRCIQQGLYSLSCVGLYFVAVEWGLWRRPPWREARRPAFFCAAAVTALFLVFPPWHNKLSSIATMGLFDRAARLILNDPFRMAAFWLAAMLACLRFGRLNLAGVLVGVNAAGMIEAHAAWDKYVLPLLVVLWHLKSVGAIDEPEISSQASKYYVSPG